MTTPLRDRAAAAACPEATIILGHMGGYFHVDEAIEVAERAGEPRPRDVGDAVPGEDPRGGRAARARARASTRATGRRARRGSRSRRCGSPGSRPRPSDSCSARTPCGSWTPSGDRRQPHLRRRVDLRLLGDCRRACSRRSTRSGIDRAVVCPAKPRGYHLGPANDAVAEAVAAAARTGSPASRASTRCSATTRARELERALGELGLRGLFLHPWEETFRVGDRRVDAVVDVARSRGVPVIVAAGYPWLSEGLQVGELARRFPDVDVRRDERRPDQHLGSRADGRRARARRQPEPADADGRRLSRGLPGGGRPALRGRAGPLRERVSARSIPRSRSGASSGRRSPPPSSGACSTTTRRTCTASPGSSWPTLRHLPTRSTKCWPRVAGSCSAWCRTLSLSTKAGDQSCCSALVGSRKPCELSSSRTGVAATSLPSTAAT